MICPQTRIAAKEIEGAVEDEMPAIVVTDIPLNSTFDSVTKYF